MATRQLVTRGFVLGERVATRGFASGSSDVVSVGSLEWSIKADRLHWSKISGRLHWKIDTGKLDWRIEK